MRYVEGGLLKEIEEKLSYLDRRLSPEAILRRDKIIKDQILKMAQYQSFRIEHPNTAIGYSIPKNGKRYSVKKGVRNIENAFKWGRKNIVLGNLTENFVQGLAGRVLPELARTDGTVPYRTTGARIVGAPLSPPDPYKVRVMEMPWFLESLNKRLSFPGKIDQLMAAFFAHYHVTRIHPFPDGNGRTSRILQDVILDKNMIPLPIIESGERYTYFEVLSKADKSWRERKSVSWAPNGATEGERCFYTFMAGKVNVSLDKVLKTLEQ